MQPPTTTFASDVWSATDAVATLTSLGCRVGRPHRVTRTLLDTFDGRLHGAGLRLVVREEDGRRTIQLDGEGVVAARVSVADVPRWPTDLPAGPLRSRVAAITAERALLATVTVQAVERPAAHHDRRGKEVVRAAVVEGMTIEGHDDARSPAVVVEVASLAGYAKAADDLSDGLELVGARRLGDDVLAVAAAAAGVDLAGFSSSPSVPLDPSMPAIDGYCAVLANLATTARANWPGAVAQIDTEFLHELRVAVRRTRSILGHARRVIPEAVLQPARDAFAAIGSATGPARDFDVQLLEWDDHAGALGAAVSAALEPILDLLIDRHRTAHTLLDVVLNSAATHEALDAWAGWLDPTTRPPICPEAAPLAGAPLGRIVAKRIRRAHRTIIDKGRLIEVDTPAEVVHDLRKDAKKLRYLLECFGGLLPAAERKLFVRSLKALQDNLGAHQDAAIHVAELRSVGDRAHRRGVPAATMLAIGELTARLDRRRAAARDEFAERFGAFDTRQTKEAMRSMLRGLDA